MANAPGLGMQDAGSPACGDTIQEALAGEIAVPPELVALTVAVFGCVDEADVVLNLPLYPTVAPGPRTPPLPLRSGWVIKRLPETTVLPPGVSETTTLLRFPMPVFLIVPLKLY